MKAEYTNLTLIELSEMYEEACQKKADLEDAIREKRLGIYLSPEKHIMNYLGSEQFHNNVLKSMHENGDNS